MIWIRADANSEIGTGHVMRCLSVATVLREKGIAVKFIVADESGARLPEARGFAYEILNSDYRDMEAELPELQKLVVRDAPKLCLVDSYFVTADYFTELGKLCKTAYVDDLFKESYPVDMVINYNIYGDLLPYKERPGKADTVFLLGTKYAPLRKEFCRDEAGFVRDNVENVLITTGGSDKYNLAGQILQAAMEDPQAKELHYHVVSGVFNPHLPKLLELESGNSHISIHRNVTNMVELMQRCDIAISAGGSTMYELCAVGVPIICFSFVENQERMVETFLKKKLVCYGGNYLQEGEALAGNVVRSLNGLAGDLEARKRYSRWEQELVDGHGARRIAQALQQMI